MEETKNSLGIDAEVKQRVAQEKRLQNVEKIIQQKAGQAPPAAPLLDEGDEEYKFVKVQSLDELKERVRRVCATLERQEQDLYNKRKFPYRLGMVLGTTAFFLALVLSFFSELPVKVVFKRSISSFFLFAFLGWLVGLVINYFSPPLGKHVTAEPEEGKGAHVDYTSDAEQELEAFKAGKELATEPVIRRAPAPGEAPPEPVPEEVVKASIEKLAKDNPEKVAQAIKGILSKGDN